MSNGIMEKNLPVAESIGEGDKVRIVTSAGNSKNIDASQIGGVFTVHVVDTDPSLNRNALLGASGGGSNQVWLDKTYGEIRNAIQNGCFVQVISDNSGDSGYSFMLSITYVSNIYIAGDSDYIYVVTVSSNSRDTEFETESVDGYPTVQM